MHSIDRLIAMDANRNLEFLFVMPHSIIIFLTISKLKELIMKVAIKPTLVTLMTLMTVMALPNLVLPFV